MRVVLLLLVICFLCVLCRGELVLNFIKNAVDRDAVCNDGTPSGFYFQKGTGSGENVWVIHQEGGACCYDDKTCTDRAKSSPVLTSSKTWANTTTMTTGIFSDSPTYSPTFYNANKVYIGYCTSDYWSGTKKATGKTGLDAWNFLGKKVTQAVIEDLISDFGMNNSNAQILFTGCSAGGKGVFANSDFVRSLLPFTPAKYLAFSDEGWNSDFPLTTGAFWYQFEAGAPLWNAQVNDRCNAAHPHHEWLCYFGSISLPYFSTTTLIHVEQYDIVQFNEDCSCTFTNKNSTMMEWMEELRVTITSTFSTMKQPHSLFSPACAAHCMSLDASFTTVSINGITLAQYLDKFWVSEGNIPYVIDTCTAFNCSQGCP